MGKKGYQAPNNEMSQINDFVFSGEAGASYRSLQPSSGAHSLLKSWKGLRRLPSDQSTVSLDSQKVIGASYSHVDLVGPDSGSVLKRSATSPEARSVQSNGTTRSPRPSLNLHTKKLTELSRSVDDDEDWTDDIDDLRTPTPATPVVARGGAEVFYPDTADLKLSSEPDIRIAEACALSESDDSDSSSAYPFLRADYEQLIRDPYTVLTSSTSSLPPMASTDASRYNKIVKALTKQPFEMTELKKQSWSGIPSSIRPLVWQVLLGYVPANGATREAVLSRKRKEYANSMTQLFRNEKDQTIWHQIMIDIPRTNPSIKLYSFETTQRSLEKVLYLWAVRHPASGYVQGINDLATPFYQIFLGSYLAQGVEVENFNPNVLPNEVINTIEADTYWCLTKVLDTIQDNYIHEQPGIIRQVTELKNLVKRDEPFLAQHFEDEGIDFIQFSFRWMNCMLMRELRLPLIVRMWDTYISNYPTGFNQFHVYVCCAFLRRFSEDLLGMDFQDIIMYLQDPGKTGDWTDEDVEMMLSEAFVWQSLYENAGAHLK